MLTKYLYETLFHLSGSYINPSVNYVSVLEIILISNKSIPVLNTDISAKATIILASFKVFFNESVYYLNDII